MTKNKKPTGNLKTLKRHKFFIIVIIALAVLMLLGVLWWLIFKHNTYSPDKESVRRVAQNLYESVNLRGKEIYSYFTDKGCTSNSVGLRSDTYCTFQGYKYYKASGVISEDLKDADSQINHVGWQRTFVSQDNTDLTRILNEGSHQALSYLNPNGFRGMTASLGYYQDKIKQNDDHLQRLVSIGKIEPPGEGEYVYGIRVGASYWGCTNNSLFNICPLPPSKPKLPIDYEAGK